MIDFSLCSNIESNKKYIITYKYKSKKTEEYEAFSDVSTYWFNQDLTEYFEEIQYN